MAPRTYAIDQRADPALSPIFIWSFDSPWLRAAALRENPGNLLPVRRADVAHRVLRAHRRGDWRDVAPGVRVYLHDVPAHDAGFPAVPRLRLPNPRDPPYGGGGSGGAAPGRPGRADIGPREHAGSWWTPRPPATHVPLSAARGRALR